MRSEDELIGALRTAGEHAPDDAGGLLAGVALRRRRRARRRLGVLAAAAAVVVLSVGIRGVVLSGGGEGDVATPPTGTPRPGSGPVERVWPRAVFTVPTKNASGDVRLPLTGVSATKVLLLSRPARKSPQLEMYDSATGETRVLAELPSTQKHMVPSVAADGVNIVWYIRGRSSAEIWTIPLVGGEPTAVTGLSGDRADVEALSVNGGQVIWSERSGDVWRVPLTGGGAPERIPSGNGLHLLRWPWASDAPAGPDTGDRSQTEVVDLTLDTRIPITVPAGVKGLRCGPHWCSGRDAKGVFVQRISGRDVHRGLDGFGHPEALSMAPILNRFVVLKNGVYDAETGVTATIPARASWLSIGTSAEPSTVVYWEGRPGTYEVLNLAAVPSAQ
ncbi:TolB family protein [[Actinomadura] parvosata]|uniref:TolB family protein n=1 Tax=[Actinomadura] parvosata TaxID=1955412 RepID=UPI00406C53BD